MTPGVSTMSMANLLISSIKSLQTQLSAAQKEQSTGIHDDLSFTLGNQLSRDFAMGLSTSDIKSIMDTNNVVATRLATTQTSLSDLSKTAQGLVSSLILARGGGRNPAPLIAQAKAALQTFTSALNTSDGASHVFGGINSDSPPITDYFANPPSANKQAVDAAFQAAFGFPQSSPNVSTITPAQMQAFLTGPVANLFSATNWKANWSGASDQAIESRISVSQTATTSVSANDAAFRDLAAGYAMVADLGLDQLNDAAYQTAIQTATQFLQKGIAGLTQLQASVGAMQSSVTSANQIMSAQSDLLNTQIGALENVDPAEVATRISGLMTQIQTSYVLTSQLRDLSLAKYL